MSKDEKSGVLSAIGDEIGQSVRLYFQPVVAVVGSLSAAIKKQQPRDRERLTAAEGRQRRPQAH